MYNILTSLSCVWPIRVARKNILGTQAKNINFFENVSLYLGECMAYLTNETMSVLPGLSSKNGNIC